MSLIRISEEEEEKGSNVLRIQFLLFSRRFWGKEGDITKNTYNLIQLFPSV